MTATTLKAAGDGEADLSFGSNGFRLIDTAPIGDVPTNERGLFAHRLADGRLLVVMQAQQANVQRAITTVLSADGVQSLATAEFPQNFNFLDPPLRGFGLDASERLLIGGNEFDPNTNRVQPVIVRALGPDYQPDPAFGVDGASRPFGSTPFAVLLAMTVLADGRSIVCGDANFTGLGQRGYCLRLDADGVFDGSFGPLIFNPPNVDMTSIGAVREDSSGRLLLAGHARMTGAPATQSFSARATTAGVLDTDYCASGCDDTVMLQTEPGYRINNLPTAGAFPCFDVRERPNGHVLHGIFQGPTVGEVGYLSHLDGGRLDRGAFFDFASIGCGSALSEPDNRTVVAHTVRFDGVQSGVLRRLRPRPTLDALFDPSFSSAPESIRAPLPGGGLATSNECNFALLEADGILCVGLARMADSPLNLDLMLYRVSNGAPPVVFGDGFEP
ncbi:MAG: hypothetical protein ACT4NL_00870 [Pseudomarimonas sp.]